MCTKDHFQTCVILDRSNLNTDASKDDDFGVRLLKIWLLNSREIHTDRDKIYTAENFDLKSHFISDWLISFLFLIFWYFDTVFEIFRFLVQ